jgi:hypothetical protein
METENQSGAQSTNQEIDLLQLFSKIAKKIKSLFIWIFNIISSAISFVWKNIFIFASCLLLGIATSYVYYKYIASPKYESHFYVKVNILTPNDYNKYIIQVQENLKEGNYNQLGKMLGIKWYNMPFLKKLNLYGVVDKNMNGVFDEMKNEVDLNEIVYKKDSNFRILPYLKIEMVASKADTSLFKQYQQGLLHYLNDIDYIKQLNTIRLQQIDENIALYNRQIMGIDSLQANYNKTMIRSNLATNGQVVFMKEKDVQLFYNDIVKLTNQKQYLELDKKLNAQAVSVFMENSVLKRITSFVTNILTTTLIFILFGIIIIMIRIK